MTITAPTIDSLTAEQIEALRQSYVLELQFPTLTDPTARANMVNDYAELQREIYGRRDHLAELIHGTPRPRNRFIAKIINFFN
jgi:hypothetical protein